MQDLIIASLPRSGSSFFAGFFECDLPEQRYFQEILNVNNARVLRFVLNQHKVSKQLIKYIEDIYLTVNRQHATQRKQLPLCCYKDLVSSAKASGLTHLISKIHIRQSPQASAEKIFKLGTSTIFIYRRSLLDSYISRLVAFYSKVWITEDPKELDISAATRVEWNLGEYLKWFRLQSAYLDEVVKEAESNSHKNLAIVNYESLVASKNKENYVKRLCAKANFTGAFISRSPILKLNHRPIEDIFVNKSQFLKDLPSLSVEQRTYTRLDPFITK